MNANESSVPDIIRDSGFVMLLLAFVLKLSEFVILLRIPNMWYNRKKLLQACHIKAGIVLDALLKHHILK